MAMANGSRAAKHIMIVVLRLGLFLTVFAG